MTKKTKIVATIGPSSEDEKTLEKMIKAGMNVARFNFSHGKHEWHQKTMQKVRKIATKLKINVGILADLQGPRIRVRLDNDLPVKKGEEILISDISFRKKRTGKNEKIFLLDYPGIIKDIKIKNEILIEDGTIKLKIFQKRKSFLIAKVINGGVIRNHKGVNIPSANLNIDVITIKDKQDLQFALKQDIDFIALSFVKNAQNIKKLRKLIKQHIPTGNQLPQIVSKIERKEAVDNLNEIIKESDGIMVARGDLGIEIGNSEVVVLQKEIIAKSLRQFKPVIVATQMLDSMIENPQPTRAEVSDVSNAIIDHTDAVMLSGESANGKYPVETIKIMTDIINKTEESRFDDVYRALDYNVKSNYAVIIRSSYELANSFGAEALCAISLSGFTARLISHFRPEQKILIATNSKKTWRQFSLLWGVQGYLFKKSDKLNTLINKTIKKAIKSKRLKKNDEVVMFIGRGPKGEKMRLLGIKKV